MEQYRVDVSEPAENDLRDIIRYISGNLSEPMAALNTIDSIEEALKKLQKQTLKRRFKEMDRQGVFFC